MLKEIYNTTAYALMALTLAFVPQALLVWYLGRILS
jgi:hypothetical protein